VIRSGYGGPEIGVRATAFIRALRIKVTVRSSAAVWLGDKQWLLEDISRVSFHPELTDDLRLHKYFLAMSA
jgi:glutamine amidotransferase PdxT